MEYLVSTFGKMFREDSLSILHDNIAILCLFYILYLIFYSNNPAQRVDVNNCKYGPLC
jgi:hypothetical protein